jgi:hypothetical protein
MESDMARLPYEWDPDFDPFTQDIVVRGSNLTLRLDRETGAEISRTREGESHGSAAGSIDPKPVHDGELESLADLAALEAAVAMERAQKLAAKADELRRAARAARTAAAVPAPVEEILPPAPPPRRGRRRSTSSAELKATIVMEFEQEMIKNPRPKDSIYWDLALWHKKSASYVKKIVLAHLKEERKWAPYGGADTPPW